MTKPFRVYKIKPNPHRTVGPITYISLPKADGTFVEALVDTEDYPKVKDTHWSYHTSVMANRTIIDEHGNKIVKCFQVRRIVMGSPDVFFFVHHIDGNTLDCRKQNLVLRTRKNLLDQANAALWKTPKPEHPLPTQQAMIFAEKMSIPNTITAVLPNGRRYQVASSLFNSVEEAYSRFFTMAVLGEQV